MFSDHARRGASSPTIAPWLMLFAIGLAWGGTGPLSKLAVSGGNHPIGITFWDALLCAAILTVFMVLRGSRLPLTPKHLVFYTVCGFLGTALPSSLSYTAYNYLTVGVNVIILAMVPMMTLAIALPLRTERADPKRILGLVLGLIAILMIFLPETSLPDPSLAIWVTLPVIVSLSYAAENVVIDSAKPAGLGPVATICGFSWAGLALIAPVMVAADSYVDITRLGPPEWAIVGNAVLHVGAYMGLIWLIERAGPVFASQVGYVTTGSGVLLGILIYDESHSGWIWGALALMLLGLWLVKMRE